MKLGISGACGLIGRKVVLVALQQSYDIKLFDLPLDINKEIHQKYFPDIEFCYGDICQIRDCMKAVEGVDAFIHLCAAVPFSPYITEDTANRTELSYKINVVGTQNIIQALESYKPDAKFIFASSGAVYGIGDAIRKVGNILNPESNQYGQQKVLAEEIVSQSQLNWVILRICAQVEEKITKKPALQAFTYRALNTKVEYGHVDDISLAFVKAIENKECIHKILNIGGGKQMQIKHEEYVRMICTKFDIPMPLESCFPSQGPGGWADTEESEKLFHYQKSSLQDIF